MTDKIGGYGRPGVDVNQAKARQVEKPERSGETGAKARSESARDAVSITDTAANLKRIEASLAQQPEVDRARVDAVRERVESGNYKVDADKVAQKLLRLEQDLS